jgi:hypothetical protein
MLSDVEEKITTVDVDPMTKQEQLKVREWSLIVIGPKEDALSDLPPWRPGHCHLTDASANQEAICRLPNESHDILITKHLSFI